MMRKKKVFVMLMSIVLMLSSLVVFAEYKNQYMTGGRKTLTASKSQGMIIGQTIPSEGYKEIYTLVQARGLYGNSSWFDGWEIDGVYTASVEAVAACTQGVSIHRIDGYESTLTATFN